MCAICGSVGLAAGAAMAPANPNASATDAAAAMVLYMVFPFVLCGRDPRTGHWMALALARFPGGPGHPRPGAELGSFTKWVSVGHGLKTDGLGAGARRGWPDAPA